MFPAVSSGLNVLRIGRHVVLDERSHLFQVIFQILNLVFDDVFLHPPAASASILLGLLLLRRGSAGQWRLLHLAIRAVEALLLFLFLDLSLQC